MPVRKRHYPIRSGQQPICASIYLKLHCIFRPMGMSKNMEKRLPQLYYIKTKFLMIWVLLHYWGHHGNAMTALRFLFIFVFLCTWSFFKGSLKGVCPCHNCLNYGKVWTNLWDGFGNILKWSFKSHKNIKIEYANNWVKKWVTYYNITATFC